VEEKRRGVLLWRKEYRKGSKGVLVGGGGQDVKVGIGFRERIVRYVVPAR
jgi:hypothetical protein